MATGIGLRIKKRREELGLSQQELAERMGLKSKSTICKIEKGDDNLTTPIIIRYAKALEIQPEIIAGWRVPIDTPEAKRIRDSYLEPTEEEKAEAEYGKRVEQALDFWDAYEQATPHDRDVVDMLLKRKRPTP